MLATPCAETRQRLDLAGPRRKKPPNASVYAVMTAIDALVLDQGDTLLVVGATGGVGSVPPERP